jgi:hypothetical protein
MVDKAQKQDRAQETAERNAQSAERQEQAVIARQLTSRNLPPGKNQDLQRALERQFGEISDLRTDEILVSDGPSVESRAVNDGVADEGGYKSELSSAAFNEGVSKDTQVISADIGQSAGSATQVFSGSGSGSSNGKGNRGLGVNEDAATSSAVSETARAESGLRTLSDRVSSAYQIDFQRCGGEYTLRQECATNVVRDLARRYPGLQQLTGSPASMKANEAMALNWIVCAAITYTALAVETSNQRDKAQGRRQPALSVPTSEGMRFPPQDTIINIDPTVVLANVSEADLTVAA